MNDKRRKEIQNVYSMLGDAKNKLEPVLSEAEGVYENMPENYRNKEYPDRGRKLTIHQYVTYCQEPPKHIIWECLFLKCNGKTMVSLHNLIAKQVVMCSKCTSHCQEGA